MRKANAQIRGQMLASHLVRSDPGNGLAGTGY